MMITPTHRSARPTRRRFVSTLALIVAATLPSAACSSSDTTATEQTDSTTPPTPATAASVTAETPTSEHADPASTDAYARLNSAIAGLGTEYTFESHTTIDGVEISIATGRRVGDASEITLTQQGTSILYRTVGAKRWLQLPGGQWKPLSNTNAPSDPLQQIGQPKQLVVTADSAPTMTMLATYDAATFSLTNTPELTVTLTLTTTTLTDIEYDTTQSGRVAHVRSTFQPAVNLDPIVTP